MLAGDPASARLAHPGAFAAPRGRAAPEGLSLRLSAGLAGSEVACLRAVLDAGPRRETEV